MSGMFSSDPTPGEIQFRLGSIPVRIQPWFWLTAFLLAGPWFDQEPRPWPVVTFVAVCFASIVWHELGHALTMRYFGARYVEIMLTGLGGLATSQSRQSHTWQRIVVALAGPANQLLIWGILFGLLKLKLVSIPPNNQIIYILIIQILMVNLYWPLFNLLPIFPLDGGRVVRESAMALLGNRGMRASLWVSIVICGGMIAWIVAAGGSMFNAMIFGMMLANNIQEIQFLRDQDRYRDPSDWRS